MVGLTDALEYVGATRQHNLGVKVLSDVHVALRDGLESRVIDATGLLSYEAGPEQYSTSGRRKLSAPCGMLDGNSYVCS